MLKKPVFLSLLLACGVFTAIHAAGERMNVLFIAIDDLNDWVGVVGGHPQAKTPNIDRLALQTGATVFERAYCPATVCCPSRSAIMTGLLPSNTGVYGNSNNLKRSPKAGDAETITEYFSRHGYHSLSSGKIFHKHPDWTGMDEGQWAFDEWEPTSGGNGISDADKPLNGLPVLGSSGHEFDWGPTVSPVEETKDYRTCKWAADQLDRDFDGKPFFMAAGVSKPHLPFYVPQEFFDIHPLDDVIVPEFRLDDLDDIRKPNGEKKYGPSDDFLRVRKADKFKEAAQAYLAAGSYADYCVGVLLDKLNKSKYADNTIVVFWGDHGWFLGEKLKYRKTHLWEESTRVPLIIRVPGKTPPGSRSDRLVNLIDLYPTLVEWCGLPPKDGIDGTSFADLRDPPPDQERPTLATMGYKNHSVRGERYRYSIHEDGTEELYDLKSDPMEYDNLINRPELQPVVKRLDTFIPNHDEPEIPDDSVDKKRFRRTLQAIKQTGPEYRAKADRAQLDPAFVREVYERTD